MAFPYGVEQNFLFMFEISGHGGLGREAQQEFLYHRGEGGVALGGYDSCSAIDLIVQRNGNVFHRLTLTRFHSFTSRIGCKQFS